MSAAQRPTLGIALTVGAAACFAMMDTTTRWLGALLPISVMLWARYSLHTLLMAGWLAFGRGMAFRPRHWRFQIARGALLLMSSALAFYGLQLLPVAEFTAIVMLTPVVSTLFARWLLDERLSWLRWALIAGGFVGALIVIRPGSGLFGWAVLFPLAASFSNAGFQVLTGKYGGDESAYTTNFYTGLVGSLLVAPVVLMGPVDIDGTLAAAPPRQIALLVAIGLLGTGGHLLLIMALGMARTSTLMPFLYTQIGFAAIVGWLVFRASPDFWGWVGMAVIAACGAASAWLNMRRPTPAVVADTVSE